jgi:hypothetical protein
VGFYKFVKLLRLENHSIKKAMGQTFDLGKSPRNEYIICMSNLVSIKNYTFRQNLSTRNFKKSFGEIIVEREGDI